MYTAVARIAAVLILALVVLVGYERASQIRNAKSESASEAAQEAQQLTERARAIQQKYWTPNAEEKQYLLEKKIDGLDWDEALRLLHLACLEMVSSGPGKEQLASEELQFAYAPQGENHDLLVRLVTRLHSDASPYKPRHAEVWQGEPDTSDKQTRSGFGRNIPQRVADAFGQY